MQEDRPDRYFIPDNLTDSSHFFHIPDRNLIETGIAELVIVYIIKLIPVSDLKIKITIGAIFVISVGILGVMGIKNESVTEFIITAVKFRKKKQILHYRRCDQKDYDEKEKPKDDNERNASKAEELLKRIEDNAAKKIERKMADRNRRIS